MAGDPTKSVTYETTKTGESLQNSSLPIDYYKSVTYKQTTTPATAYDPFAGKTNKYAESKLVKIIASGAFNFKWGTTAPTATVNDDFQKGTGNEVLCVVNSAAPYLSIVAAGAIDVYVTEVY